MNVAFFHSSLPEPGRKLGGVEVFVHRLACRLTERGHTVRMCSFSPRPEGAPYDFVRAGSRWLGTSQSARLGLSGLFGSLVLIARPREQPSSSQQMKGGVENDAERRERG